ncbi:MAG: hypothetical protein WC003_16760 [Terrimicrobiaceae bacterium]
MKEPATFARRTASVILCALSGLFPAFAQQADQEKASPLKLDDSVVVSFSGDIKAGAKFEQTASGIRITYTNDSEKEKAPGAWIDKKFTPPRETAFLSFEVQGDFSGGSVFVYDSENRSAKMYIPSSGSVSMDIVSLDFFAPATAPAPAVQGGYSGKLKRINIGIVLEPGVGEHTTEIHDLNLQ